ncbi:hypothetical protein PR202_gb16299 [Eleusine coracana subsp. coracana]|uniref:Uncharacterized protein n=1 Tax=Eleusine coracana subsp. coracana TaxID=191504 RepID=A0AAV5EZF0_ELECO|nr:hypothetical protein PR202_gb16299 [Eleusine coracana subsp. coracana]
MFGLANVELSLASLLLYFDWEAPGVPDPTQFNMTESFGAESPASCSALSYAYPCPASSSKRMCLFSYRQS